MENSRSFWIEENFKLENQIRDNIYTSLKSINNIALVILANSGFSEITKNQFLNLCDELAQCLDSPLEFPEDLDSNLKEVVVNLKDIIGLLRLPDFDKVNPKITELNRFISGEAFLNYITLRRRVEHLLRIISENLFQAKQLLKSRLSHIDLILRRY